jgi:hypothetical protein
MTLDRRRIVSLDLAADADTAWAHLRRPELIRRWYGWDAESLDLEIHQVFVAQVEAVSDGRRRSLHWADGTRLELSPTADPARTHLSVERPSHEGLSPFDGVRDDLDESWTAYVHQLQFALAVHRGEERRTWRAQGLDAGPPHDRVLDRIGLHGVRGVPIGGHVSALRPDGTRVGGTVAYRTSLQFGLRLHGFAESFLVVMERPAVLRPPHGELDVVLSTYGMDDERFAQVRDRWSGWWWESSAAVARSSVR